MAEEFLLHNGTQVQEEFRRSLGTIPIKFEPHLALKRRVPGAIGLVRTGESRIYTNLVLESA